MAQRAEPAQHGRDQRPRQRAVALGKAGQCGARIGAVELIVERATAAQHAVEDVGGEAPGGQARHGIGCGCPDEPLSLARRSWASWLWIACISRFRHSGAERSRYPESDNHSRLRRRARRTSPCDFCDYGFRARRSAAPRNDAALQSGRQLRQVKVMSPPDPRHRRNLPLAIARKSPRPSNAR